MSDTSRLIIIPARAGSSFKGKNLFPLLSRPLIHYTFDCVLPFQDQCDILVSTDDEYIKDEAEKFKFGVHHRPKLLANDTATLDAVLYNISLELDYHSYVLLPPTSPLRSSLHLREAMDLFDTCGKKADSLISVTEERRSIWKKHGDFFAKPIVERKKNRQLEAPVYIANGAIFIINRDVLQKVHRKIGGKIVLYTMDERSSVDIHDLDDIELAEFYLKHIPKPFEMEML